MQKINHRIAEVVLTPLAGARTGKRLGIIRKPVSENTLINWTTVFKTFTGTFNIELGTSSGTLMHGLADKDSILQC